MKVMNISFLHMKKQTQSDGICPQTHVVNGKCWNPQCWADADLPPQLDKTAQRSTFSPESAPGRGDLHKWPSTENLMHNSHPKGQ